MQAQGITRQTPFYIVLNARSGAGKAGDLQAQIGEILRSAGQPHEFSIIEEPQQTPHVAAQVARDAERNSGAIVVGGGDGTINSVVHASLASGRPFGIIPQGTFNYVSRAYGIPSDPREAVRALVDAQLRPVQVGALNDRIFLVNASLGLHPHLLQEREHFTREYGRMRVVALWAGLTTLMRGYRQLTLEIEHDSDRETVRTPSLFVGNNPLQLERVGLPEADDIERHRLAAVIVRPVATRTLLWLALRGALGQLGDDRNVRNFPFSRLSVRAVRGERGRKIKVSTDGEIAWLHPPLHFSVAPHPLMLMVPADARQHEAERTQDAAEAALDVSVA